MLTCFFCPNTKKHMNEITNQVFTSSTKVYKNYFLLSYYLPEFRRDFRRKPFRRNCYVGILFATPKLSSDDFSPETSDSFLLLPAEKSASKYRFSCSEVKGLSLKVNTTKGWWQRKTTEIDADELAKRKAKQIATLDEEEWVAEPEQGVLITLVPQIDGSNYLQKIRFSEDRFNTVEAQKWWSDNYDKLIELYNIRLPPSPYQSDEDEDDINSIQLHKQSATTNSKDVSIAIQANDDSTIAVKHNSTTTCLKGVKGKVIKWVVEDEPGVYVTIRSLPDDIKEIVRVELSQERFGELNAREWWDENKVRLLEQYL